MPTSASSSDADRPVGVRLQITEQLLLENARRAERPATHPSVITTRLAHQADVAQVAEVTRGAYVDEGLLAPDDDYVEELIDTRTRLREGELWVAELDGRVVGAVTFCPPGSTYRELSKDGEAEFRMLAVDPSARGCGVGAALVRRCIDRAHELRLGAVVLCTMPQMRPAHRLYESLGFRRDESLDWDVDQDMTLIGYRLIFEPT